MARARGSQSPGASTERVLIVDDAPDVLDMLARTLAPECNAVTALGAAEGRRRCAEEGPFAVVISDYDMPDQSGGEFLERVHAEWPDTVTVMLTGVVEVDVAIQALHRGRIFRFLEKPCPRERLVQALRDALVEYRLRRRSRARAEELEFSRHALESFNGALERRVGEQAAALVRLHVFVNELNMCESLDGIADRTAAVCFELCNERGVFVELLDETSAGGRCHAMRGPALSPDRVVQPVETYEGRIGSLVVDDGAGRARLSRDQRSVLSSIAASCAVAVRNHVRRRERDEAQHATILALARLAERRDNETGKHLERVSLFCKLIAEGLREDGWYREVISEAFVRDLVRSAPLHDIGKVGIPDAILLKPGKLTPDEWRVMKTHTDIGAETLRSVISESSKQRFLEMSLDIAWCHHEKWDGSGYPRGLAGLTIPLSARILALADVYDALTSERPYKKAWPHADALRWIVAGSGTHFDPRVVEAFVTREDRANEIRSLHADTPEDLARVGCHAA